MTTTNNVAEWAGLVNGLKVGSRERGYLAEALF